MVINPLCDIPWGIYLDYLADQGFDELREINISSLVAGDFNFLITPMFEFEDDYDVGIGDEWSLEWSEYEYFLTENTDNYGNGMIFDNGGRGNY